MSKKQREKKHSGRGQKLTSPLSSHSRVGKTLVPPMMQMKNISFQSWSNNRLPEMLWACLVVSVLPREAALGAFREISAIGIKYREEQDRPAKGWSLDLSALPTQPPEIFEHLVNTVTRHPLGYAALRPLLLLENLPGTELWRAALATEASDDDWRTLGSAVLLTFDHQSQQATDVRWLRLLFKLGLGELRFPKELTERIDELIDYPNRGDMRKVRPFIRSSEGALAMFPDGAATNPWPDAFWTECLRRTGCVPAPPAKRDSQKRDTKAITRELLDVRKALLDHHARTITTTGVDAKHDAVFGFGLFALSCLLELMSGRNGFGITGRLLLRSLTECRISLAYLLRCGDEAMWVKFRSYGAGQAKLALLKFEEMPEDPTFVERATLESLANEDFYQEYVQIDLGHWCGKDLRKMAEDSGTKDDYDRIYGWASGFVHGQWGALRDSNMTHCLNPLHRFHRVPLWSHRMMEDAVPDAVGLINSILDDIDRAYPGFPARFKWKSTDGATVPETSRP